MFLLKFLRVCVCLNCHGFSVLTGWGCAGTGFEGGDRAVVPAAEVGEALRTLGDNVADSARQGLVGSIPKRVKLKIGRISLVMSFEFFGPLLQQFQGDLPGPVGGAVVCGGSD